MSGPGGAAGEPTLTAVPDVLPAEHYALRPHPLVPLPSAEEAAAFLARPGGAEELTKLLNNRGELIWRMESDPYQYGAELPHWAEARRQFDLGWLTIVFGGNRASKSEFAAREMVRTMDQYPGAVMLAMHESLESSIATVQKLIWKYLPLRIKALNKKEHAVYKVSYSQANGFAGNKLIFPNGSELVFGAYKQDPGIYEGWELGARQAPALGAWADENMSLPWLRMFEFRLATRKARLVWTFTPVNGITATIKDVVGNAPTTEESRFAELLADRVNLPGLPKGHMPYIQQPYLPGARVIYFFSQWNPFGHSYERIKQLCAGRPSEFVERRAYGYARDTSSRAFPLFGEWNVVKESHLPAEGTNYMATDPAGARNWASLWVRVAPGEPRSLYIYRDWPDFKRFGEWAVTAANPNKFDGERGPAQNAVGYGPVEYKNLFLKEERIHDVPTERDPFRLRVLAEAKAAGADLAALREPIRERLIDPRAGKNQHAVDKGGVCLVDKLAEVNRHPKSGEVTAPSLFFQPARGVDIIEGVNLINTLLYWDREQDLVPLLNFPRLFVSERCKQLIWALQNWTGEDGQEGACKDFIDLLRYLVTWDIRHITPGRVKTTGGGSY